MKISKIEYDVLNNRVEELLSFVNEDTPNNNPHMLELDLLSKLMESYEEAKFTITKPSLIESIKLRMFEMGLSQTDLSKLLGISNSRLSEYLNGKAEPTLKIARIISQKLNIDPDIILGI